MEGLPNPTLTLPEVFALRSEREAEKPALHLVVFSQGDPIARPYTYAALARMTRTARMALAESGLQPRQRIVLSLSNAAEFLSFFIGALCLGAVPVPVPSLGELAGRAYGLRIAAIVNDARPSLIIVEDAVALAALPPDIQRTADVRALTDLRRRTDLVTSPGELISACEMDDVAFLQYTSGTTGDPKGVVVLHRNLVANLRAISQGACVGSGDVIYSWLPLFHDMGLVAGLLLGVYLGIPTYVAQPRSFVYRPESWLRSVSAFRATFSPGPNFAFDVLARKVAARTLAGIDLSCWRLAFDGAELVDPVTVRAFVDRYAPYGFSAHSFRPAYGLAECTLAAAFPRPGVALHFDSVDRSQLVERGIAQPAHCARAGTVTFTSVGSALPAHRIRILEVGGARELPERRLGEIAISGPSISPGYHAELGAGAPARSELRTDDLGYIAEGQLYVVDRLKDLLVVAGRKYSPANIELVVSRIGGVRHGAVIAFSTRGDNGTEEAYVVAGLEPSAAMTKDELQRIIRRVLRDDLDFWPTEVFLVRPGLLPKTCSGKVMRSACAAMLKAGRFHGRGAA